MTLLNSWVQITFLCLPKTIYATIKRQYWRENNKDPTCNYPQVPGIALWCQKSRKLKIQESPGQRCLGKILIFPNFHLKWKFQESLPAPNECFPTKSPKRWEEFEKSIMMLFWQANFLEPPLVLVSWTVVVLRLHGRIWLRISCFMS